MEERRHYFYMVHKLWTLNNSGNPPHKLVWARQKGFPYWPAKVIKQENNMYDVRFFGGYHQRANVESENIRPISTSLQKLSVKRTASLNKALKELKHHQGLVKKYHQTYTRTTSSRCGTAPCSRAKLRKYSDTSSVGYKTNELPGESPEVREEFEKEGPPCLSQKTARIQVAASPDDHNVVSSSSQEFLSAKVSVCTQTPKKLLTGLLSKGGSTEKQDSMLAGDNCKCNAKYSKLFKEFKERFEKEHKVEKEEAVKKLVKKLQAQFEQEKETTLKVTFGKLQKEVEKARKKAEEQLRFRHKEEVQRLIERQDQEISEIKKKQWCYNCEAEAIYHCCWNVSYCSLECQQVHWHKEHKQTCRRKRL
ncbi:zinc finger MYND domain-containing protein 11-like isoform X2 [Tachypleus tridentatus]|uniref:zinc finger MYND domain-containing protein 11-like isoform X2 n=1 Tax=Tachypleus tridentatus TaxID=6853 RepID=UPI003FD1E898